MKLFGRELTLPAVSSKASADFSLARPAGTAPSLTAKSADDIAHFDESGGGWWPVIREGFTGAWQQNITIRRDTLLAFTAVYACINRITRDIAKMPLCIHAYNEETKVYEEIAHSSPYLPVLTKPNFYQNRIQFIQQWVISKLIAGNTYVLKERDNRRVVTALYVLDPTRVRPLITPDGDIFYELGRDPLSDLQESVIAVPQSEIIHDRMPAFFHPLVGTSPIFSCALAAAQGHAMQKTSAAFFKNSAQPSGILTAAGAIKDETATRLRKAWETGFQGSRSGMIAVLGDGLKFERLTVSAADAQLIEQLKMSGEMVCSAFSVPPFMVGIGPLPTYTNIEAMQQQYWSQCLQSHIEDIETCLTLGLGLDTANSAYGEMCVKMNLDVLLRMDTATRIETWKTAVSGGIFSPNEARQRENMAPVKGGETPYLQVQNYPLDALSSRGPAPAPAAGGGAPTDGGTAPSEPKKQITAEEVEEFFDTMPAFGELMRHAA